MYNSSTSGTSYGSHAVCVVFMPTSLSGQSRFPGACNLLSSWLVAAAAKSELCSQQNLLPESDIMHVREDLIHIITQCYSERVSVLQANALGLLSGVQVLWCKQLASTASRTSHAV